MNKLLRLIKYRMELYGVTKDRLAKVVNSRAAQIGYLIEGKDITLKLSQVTKVMAYLHIWNIMNEEKAMLNVLNQYAEFYKEYPSTKHLVEKVLEKYGTNWDSDGPEILILHFRRNEIGMKTEKGNKKLALKLAEIYKDSDVNYIESYLTAGKMSWVWGEEF